MIPSFKTQAHSGALLDFFPPQLMTAATNLLPTIEAKGTPVSCDKEKLKDKCESVFYRGMRRRMKKTDISEDYHEKKRNWR